MSDLDVRELAEELLDTLSQYPADHDPEYASLDRDQVASFLAQARREGREETMETMKPELYRLAMVEVWARRHGGNIKVWATEAREGLGKPGGERHAAGHLHRIIEAAERLLDQLVPEGEKTP